MKLLADLSSEQVRLQNHLREKAGLDPIPDQDTELFCRKCNTWKLDEDFYRNGAESSTKRRGRSYACRVCSNRERRAWREQNRARDNRTVREYRHRMGYYTIRDPVNCPGCDEVFDMAGLSRHKAACLSLTRTEDVC